MEKNEIIKMIHHWSEVFNLPIKQELAMPDVERVHLAISLIEEELRETKQAIVEKDLREIQDGLGDLLWVVVRAMMEFGVDPEKTIKAIYDSNMSKADVSEEDATITYKKYMDQGIQTYCRERKGLFITYRVSDNKVLKSHNFKTPEL